MTTATPSPTNHAKTTLSDVWDHNRVRTYKSREAREQAVADNLWMRGADVRAALGEDPWRSPDQVLTDIESQHIHLDAWDAPWAAAALDWYQESESPEKLLSMSSVVVGHERWSWAVSSLEAVAITKRTKTGVLLALGWESTDVDDETLEAALHTALQFEMEVTGLNHLHVITMETRHGHAPRPRITRLMRTMKDRESDITVAEAMKDWRWRYKVGEDVDPPDRSRLAQHPPIRIATDTEQDHMDELVTIDRELARLRSRREAICSEVSQGMDGFKAVVGTSHKLAWVTPARAADIDVDALAEEWPEAYKDVLRRTKNRPRELRTFIGGIRR